jgi:nucleotide-binding universal stress UspA family protein
MIEKILFPVAFSPSCVTMSTHVKRAAAIFGSQVTLVHVCDLASHNGFELYVRSLPEIAEEHWSIARIKLDSFLESEFPPNTCPRILRSGEAAAQIAELARTGGFDLIVMPTHAGRFRQMLLGSTTAKVLNDADCPVLTTAHAETINPRPLEHREWACAIGLGRDSERVLRLANRAAAEVRAKLSVIHAICDGALAPIQLNDREQCESPEKKDPRRGLDELQETVGCKATVHIAIGPVKEALLDAARRSAADVLIIGRTPKAGALGRLRDLTYGLVRDSPVPVLSV